MNAIEVLIEEHNNIEIMLKIIRKASLAILEGAEVDYDDFNKMIYFVRNYADDHHHKKEEIMLFNRMVDEIGETAEKVVKYGMLVEHDLGRLYISSLSEALENYKNGNNEAKLDIIANAVSYTNLLQRHIYKENNVVFRFGERELNKDTIEIINNECEEFELEFRQNKKENLSILKELMDKYCI